MRKAVLLLSVLFFFSFVTTNVYAQAQGRQGQKPPPATGSSGDGKVAPKQEPPPPPPPPPPPKDPPPSRTPPPSGGGSGQAVPRKDPPPAKDPPPSRTPPPSGGSSSGSSGAVQRGSGRSSGSTSDPDRGSAGTRTGDNNSGRDRGTSPITGRATPRPEPPKVYTQWYPIYIGYNQRDVMFRGYNPYRYRNGCWLWGHYDRNYFGYDPGCDSYWWRYPYNSSRDRYIYTPKSSRLATPKAPAMGSIRLKANPNTASVYINGVLVGVVDEFDGLTDHLKLEPGFYQLEIRADGYQIFTKELRVVGGKTVTERISLKKK